MHELSVALSIIEGVEQEIEQRGGAPVLVVHLRLGPLSGVIPDALQSAYDLARENTVLADTPLVIERIPVVLYCESCHAERPAVSLQRLCCATCDTPSFDIRHGKELEIYALEMASQ